MDRIEQEGEQFLDGGNNNQGQSQGNDMSQQQGGGQQQQQSSGNSSGGGFMKGFEQNTGDAYLNQEANQFMTKEGVPSAMDGAIDGAMDTEANKLEKDL